MGFEKAIEHNKEHRKPYKEDKAKNKTKRNHGSNNWDLSNRMIHNMKENEKMDYGEMED